MIEVWSPALFPTLVAILLLIVPGAMVIVSGWGFRRIGLLFLAPAVSVALLGASAIIAPLVGLPWDLLPVALLSAAVAVVAFLIRARGAERRGLVSRSVFVTPLVALAAAASVIAVQFMRAFGDPRNISQTFDNILHLNSIRYALETQNASMFHIGDTSDVEFYPNGWHSLTTLVAGLSGADVPVAVNAANLAIGAVLWTGSSMALAWVLFRGRRSAMVATAALTTAFGAFPGLLWSWGVLYPNVTGYAMIPAMMALTVRLLEPAPARSRVRDSLLLLLITGGVVLAHPNAFLGGFLFSAVLAIGLAIRTAMTRRDRSSVVVAAAIVGVLAGLFAVLWNFARTPADHSIWPSTQSFSQAVGQAVLVSPQGFRPSVVIVVLLLAAFVGLARRPSMSPVALPFVAACALYVAVTGLPTQHPVRLYLTNPWYSDSNRFAAMLPLVAVPLLAFGAVYISDLVLARIGSAVVSARAKRPLLLGAAALGAVLLLSLPAGSSVAAQLRSVNDSYQATGRGLLSVDERALLERLDSEVPADAIIIGSPWTGASLAYALADREVVRKHVFGDIGDDEQLLDSKLRLIDEDPRVCAAVDRLGVDFVLDFGDLDVWGGEGPLNYPGVIDLDPTPGLVLVDQEGDARLFAIEGC